VTGHLSSDKEASNKLCWQTHDCSVFAKQKQRGWDWLRGTAFCDDVCEARGDVLADGVSASTYGSPNVLKISLVWGHTASQNFILFAVDNSCTRSR
jgi:hypothetical protein